MTRSVVKGVGAVVAAIVAIGAAPAGAAIEVETTSDTPGPGDGQCSLREAVAAANSPATPSADCPGAEPGGLTVIQVPAGTYLLTEAGQLVIEAGADVELRAPTRLTPAQRPSTCCAPTGR